ncbi:MAG: hypothetical protein ABIK28_07500, partial [Planctomycetota bacterium]
MRRKDLEGHPAFEGDFLGLVHHAHAAPAELSHDAVIAEDPFLALIVVGRAGKDFLSVYAAFSAQPQVLGYKKEFIDLFAELRTAFGVSFTEPGGIQPLACMPGFPESLQGKLHQIFPNAIFMAGHFSSSCFLKRL